MHCLLCHFSCFVRGSWDIFSRSDVAEALRLQAQHLHLDNQLLRQSHAYEHFSRMYTEHAAGYVKPWPLTKEMPSPGESISAATEPQFFKSVEHGGAFLKLYFHARHHDLLVVMLFVEIP